MHGNAIYDPALDQGVQLGLHDTLGTGYVHLTTEADGSIYMTRYEGTSMYMDKISIERGTTGENITVTDGNNYITDTTFDDHITLGNGHDVVYTIGGNDVVTMGNGAGTVVIERGRTVDNGMITITNFDESKGQHIDLSQFLAPAEIDVSHIQVTGPDSAHLTLEVKDNLADPWHAVAQLNGASFSDGSLSGPVHAMDQAQLDAATQHVLAGVVTAH